MNYQYQINHIRRGLGPVMTIKDVELVELPGLFGCEEIELMLKRGFKFPDENIV